MLPALALCFLSSAYAQQASDWSLVGVYDAAAVTSLDPTAEADYAWEDWKGMTTSCGPSKTPDGLGVFEAVTVANRLSPTLAVVLERKDDGGMPLESNQVYITLGTDTAGVRLEPMVDPRFIAVTIDGEADDRYKQLIRTQLAMELCMEHKTGRGWIGGDGSDLREAFLLDERDRGGLDRKYYAAQKHPVPAMLGPADACFRPRNELERRTKPDGGGNGKGESSMGLVPADVWGSDLRICNEDIAESPGQLVRGRSQPVQLRLSSEDPDGPPTRAVRRWGELKVTLVGDEDSTDKDILMDVEWCAYEDADAPCEQLNVKQWPLFQKPEGDDEARFGLRDVLAQVPHTFPMMGSLDDPDRYAVLLIPNWQIVEAIQRLNGGDLDGNGTVDADDLKISMRSGGSGLQDGVGWVLEHPEALFIQVAPSTALPRHSIQRSETIPWNNLSTSLGGHTGVFREWGYTVGQLSGRAPIALPAKTVPTWSQASKAQRSAQHGFFIGSTFFTVVLVFLGIVRLQDLWSKIPEERVAYWPGRASQEATKDPQKPTAPPGAS